MARKIKVVGRKLLTSRVPSILPFDTADTGTVFDMGTFSVTRNVPTVTPENLFDEDGEPRLGVTPSPLIQETINQTIIDFGLESLLEAQNQPQLGVAAYRPRVDVGEPTNLAYFASLYAVLSRAVAEIIRTWPGGLEADPAPLTENANPEPTAYAYSYNARQDRSTFRVPALVLKNPYQLTLMAPVDEDVDGSGPLGDLARGWKRYCLLTNGGQPQQIARTQTDGSIALEIIPSRTHNIISYETERDNNGNLTWIVLELEGDVFPVRPTNPNYASVPGTWLISLGWVIRPIDREFAKWKNTLSPLAAHLIPTDTKPLYQSTFQVRLPSDDGLPVIQPLRYTWPNKNGYDIINSGPGFDRYAHGLLEEMALAYDESRQTNLLAGRYVPGNLLELDQTLYGKGKLIVDLYATNLDLIKKDIDGVKSLTKLDYNIFDTAPDPLVREIARLQGWEPVSLQTETRPGRGGEAADAARWRLLGLNASWFFRSKGTRTSIDGLINLLGIPEGLVRLNEHVYVVRGRRAVPITKTTEIIEPIGSEEAINTVTTLSNRLISGGDAVDTNAEIGEPEDAATGPFEEFVGGRNVTIQAIKDAGWQLERVIDNHKSWTSENVGIRQHVLSDTLYDSGPNGRVINTKEIDILLSSANAMENAIIAAFFDELFTLPIGSDGEPIGIEGVQGAAFARELYTILVNVAGRKTVYDGHGGGYPALMAVLYRYLISSGGTALTMGTLSNISRQLVSMWPRMVKQLLPETAWLTGQGEVIQNTIFTPQKYVYRSAIDGSGLQRVRQAPQPKANLSTVHIRGKARTSLKARTTSTHLIGEVAKGEGLDGALITPTYKRLPMRHQPQTMGGGDWVSINTPKPVMDGAGKLADDSSWTNDSPAIYSIDNNTIGKNITLRLPLYFTVGGNYEDAPNWKLIKTQLAVIGIDVIAYNPTTNRFGPNIITTVNILPSDWTLSNDEGELRAQVTIPSRVLARNTTYLLKPFMSVDGDVLLPLRVGGTTESDGTLSLITTAPALPWNQLDEWTWGNEPNDYSQQFATSPNFFNRKNNAIYSFTINTRRAYDAGYDSGAFGLYEADYDYQFVSLGDAQPINYNVTNPSIVKPREEIIPIKQLTGRSLIVLPFEQLPNTSGEDELSIKLGDETLDFYDATTNPDGDLISFNTGNLFSGQVFAIRSNVPVTGSVTANYLSVGTPLRLVSYRWTAVNTVNTTPLFYFDTTHAHLFGLENIPSVERVCVIVRGTGGVEIVIPSTSIVRDSNNLAHLKIPFTGVGAVWPSINSQPSQDVTLLFLVSENPLAAVVIPSITSWVLPTTLPFIPNDGVTGSLRVELARGDDYHFTNPFAVASTPIVVAQVDYNIPLILNTLVEGSSPVVVNGANYLIRVTTEQILTLPGEQTITTTAVSDILRIQTPPSRTQIIIRDPIIPTDE